MRQPRPRAGVFRCESGGKSMELFLKIIAAAAMGMIVVYAWFAYKGWQEHGPKPQKGDWEAVILPLALVVGVVILLVAIVR